MPFTVQEGLNVNLRAIQITNDLILTPVFADLSVYFDWYLFFKKSIKDANHDFFQKLFNLLRFCLRCLYNYFIVYNGDDPRTSRQPFTNFAQGQFYPVSASALNNQVCFRLKAVPIASFSVNQSSPS